MTTQVKASHILVQTEEEAKELLRQIKEESADFAKLAAEHSLCPSGARGGDLGYFGRGQMVKPFEDAAFSMEIGAVSEPIETQFGWHLLYLEDKK